MSSLKLFVCNFGRSVYNTVTNMSLTAQQFYLQINHYKGCELNASVYFFDTQYKYGYILYIYGYG